MSLWYDIRKKAYTADTTSNWFRSFLERRLSEEKAGLDSLLDDKVDKVTGKVLSSNDYTTAEKQKLSGIEAAAQKNTVTSVSGKVGAVSLTKSDVGLSNVDNTADLNKPVSQATEAAIDLKLDKSNPVVTGTFEVDPPGSGALGEYAQVVKNRSDDNVFTLDWWGNAWLKGDIIVNAKDSLHGRRLGRRDSYGIPASSETYRIDLCAYDNATVYTQGALKSFEFYLSNFSSLAYEFNVRVLIKSDSTDGTTIIVPDTIKFCGDDCDNQGEFTPAPEKYYEIDFAKCYDKVVGRVGAF